MSDTMLEAAIELAERGFAVFPLKAKGKSPITAHGVKEATTNPEQIREWWYRYKDANIGIALGSASGNVFAIDIDVDEEKGKDGFESLREYEIEHGALPDTPRTITGRKGSHILYRYNGPVRNRVGIYDGVDIRGDGGYIVAPPSVHANGNTYKWDVEYNLDDYQIADADENVQAFAGITQSNEIVAKEKFVLPDLIKDGERNETLFRYASSLQSQGKSDDEIMALVIGTAMTKCQTPFKGREIDELKKTIESALKYEKGEIALKKADGKVIQSIENARILLTEDESLRDRFRWNSLSYSVFICGQTPWTDKKTYREWQNNDKSRLLEYCERFGLKSEKQIMIALDNVANDFKFNPLIQHLESLPKWDGQKHIAKLLPKYLGANDDAVTEASMRLTMLGAIYRAYEPGCKFDYMLVLMGPQGCGKSYFLSQLAMSPVWYDDNFNTIEGNEAKERLRGKWIVEMAELLASKRSKDVEAMKAFITSRADSYRPPYKEATEHRPRQCIFTGTTNDDSFLSDSTGNRRFLPIRVNGVGPIMWDKKDEFKNDVEQAWAEALHIYRTEKPELVFPRNLEGDLNNVRTSFVQEDIKKGIILKWLGEKTTPDRICAADAWKMALGESRTMTNFESKSIVAILKELCSDPSTGWKFVGVKSCETAKKVNCFQRIGYVEGIKEDDSIEF